MPTITVYPSGYDSTNSDYKGWYSGHAANLGYTDANSTTYAGIYLNTGNYADTKFYWTFNLSSLPSNAIINSVTCTAKCHITSTSGIPTRTIQMSSGTTAKGTASTLTTTSGQQHTLSVGDWTAAELQNACIYLHATRSTTSATTDRTFRFYGATLTIDYSEAPSNTLYFKNNGTWTATTKVYKKVSGLWVEQSDLTTVFSSGTNYKEG